MVIIIIVLSSIAALEALFFGNPDIILYEGIIISIVLVFIIPPLCTLLTAIAATLLVVQEEDEDDVFKTDDQKRTNSMVTMEPVRHTKARRTTSVRSDTGLYVIKEENDNNMPDHISLHHRFSTTSLPALAPLIGIGENVYVKDDSDMKDVFVVTKNPFHLDRRYCQNLNMAATVLLLLGYTLIGLSISIGMNSAILTVL